MTSGKSQISNDPVATALGSDTTTMRVLHLSSARQLGGGERHLADLANALARRGHDVYVALVPSSPLLTELLALPNQNILELPMRGALSVVRAGKLARFMRTNRIEIIHAHVGRDYPLAAMAARQANNARLVLTRHSLFPLNRIHRAVLRHVARVIAVSRAVADGLRAQEIFDRERIVVIHNGIDIDRFAKVTESDSNERQDSSRRLCVGTIGELTPVKGQKDFLRAAAIVCSERDDVDFVIAGEDQSPTAENRRQIERLVAELRLGRRVQITGWADDVAKLLRTFDLFVSASQSESFGIAIIEAMASSVPVVSTSTPGAQEIIEANRTGRLVPIGDAEALAKSICDLLANPKERRRLAANAQDRVRERFSLARMVEATEQLYRQVLSDG